VKISINFIWDDLIEFENVVEILLTGENWVINTSKSLKGEKSGIINAGFSMIFFSERYLKVPSRLNML
jgi:hypothetical protein|tara:strand:- start:57049 stop:57252 length:204 start_codon:yes stop_codon:yes gene_type:complete